MSEVNIKTDTVDESIKISQVTSGILSILHAEAEQETIRAALRTFADVMAGSDHKGRYINYDRGEGVNQVSASIRG